MLSLMEAAVWTGLKAEEMRAVFGDLPPEIELPSRIVNLLKHASELDCSFKALNHDAMRHLVKPSGRRIITVGIQKGGVGKTVAALNIAISLAAAGVKTLFIDLDHQASATNFLLPEDADYAALPTTYEVCTDPEMDFAKAATPTRFQGLSLVASKPAIRKTDRLLHEAGPAKFMAAKLENCQYECILFDVPPSLGELVKGAYALSSQVIMPILPDIWSIESVTLSISDIQELATEYSLPMPAINLLRNRFRQGRIASTETQNLLAEDHEHLIMPMSIPETAAIQNLVNDGVSALECGSPAVRKAFLDVSSFIWHKGGNNAQATQA